MKYGDKVFYYERDGEIKTALYGEEWEENMTYIQKEKCLREETIETERIYPTRELARKAYMEKTQEHIDISIRVIEKLKEEIQTNTLKLEEYKRKTHEK